MCLSFISPKECKLHRSGEFFRFVHCYIQVSTIVTGPEQTFNKFLII